MRIKLIDGGKMPTSASKGSAGYDLYSIEEIRIPAGTHKKVRTGVCMEIPRSLVGTISHRSGMNTKKGIQAYGRVDSDYRGEIMATLFNAGDSPVVIEVGDRIAQIVFVHISHCTFEAVDNLNETERGEGGYGSTGR